MDPNRKYFGMTSKQLAILGGLALVACLLLIVASWLFLDTGSGLFVRAAEATPVPQLTATLIVIPTASPTETPTPVPYEMLIPQGWVQFKSALVEIWLPDNFKRGDPKKFSDPADLAALDMVMTGKTSKSSLYTMNVMVSYTPLTAPTLEAFLDSELTKLPSGIRLTERRKISVNSVEAVRMVFETRIESFDANEMVYAFLDGGTVWFVLYVAQINEFFMMLPEFEKSVQTFRIVR